MIPVRNKLDTMTASKFNQLHSQIHSNCNRCISPVTYLYIKQLFTESLKNYDFRAFCLSDKKLPA